MSAGIAIRTESHQLNDELLWQLCHDAKNLYNQALYLIRDQYINHKKYIGYREVYELIKHEDCYLKLASQAAQSVLRRLDCNWKSFFALRKKEIKSHISEEDSKVRIPKYKHKDGHFVWEYAGPKLSVRDNVITIPKTKYKIRTKHAGNKIVWLRIIPKNDRVTIEIIYEKNIEANENLKLGKTIGIDIGINNLMAIASNENDRSCLVNGRPLKSMSHYYNKKLARLKRTCKITSGKDTSKQIRALHRKRNNKINHFMHCASKLAVEYCIAHNVSNIAIGHNKGWKNKCNIGKHNNQTFCQIPMNRLISLIEYKAAAIGIVVTVVEESYTSKADHLLWESMTHLAKRSGKRTSRGMFKSGSGIKLNSDINGAYGMLRKINAVDERFFESIVDTGHVVWPLKLNVVCDNRETIFHKS